MLTADQAARRGIDLAPEGGTVALPEAQTPLDASAVMAGGAVKVYTLGRSVDQTDPDVLHEQHVVYRREATPRWRLDPPSGQKILVGPGVTEALPDAQPLLGKELSGYLAEQRRAMDANQKAIAALFEAVDTLNRQQQTLARAAAAGGTETSREAAKAAPSGGVPEGPGAAAAPTTGSGAYPAINR